MSEWEFEVRENGAWVTGGSAPTKGRAMAEAARYAMIYRQDGGEIVMMIWESDNPKRRKTKR